MARKTVSAFSVYKEQRLTEHEEDEPPNYSVTDSTVSDGCATTSPVADESMEEGESVRQKKGEVSEAGRKRKIGKRKLLSKKRKLDSSQESESTEGSVGRAGKMKERHKVTKRLKKKESIKKKRSIVKRKLSKGRKKGDTNELDDEATPTPASPKLLKMQGEIREEVQVPFFSQFNPDDHKDSRDAGKELLRLLINPFSLDVFFDEIWEQRPLLLSRHMPQYNDGWFSTKELDGILRKCDVEFTTNIDITSYQGGERQTHNLDGRVIPQVVWDLFEEGCSVRLLNPQTYSSSMWLLTATLQEHFQSFVGANVYLTPAGTQGFAPHSDDIEAFVVQLEGKKHWKLYSPRENSEVLPRFSSPNLSEKDLGEPILDVILEAGDLLYFPRGTYHQAEALPDIHSLHVTLSTYQKYTWGDLMAKLMSSAVELAMQEDVGFRRGLPVGCLDYMGRHTNCDTNDPRRLEFSDKLNEYMEKLIEYVPVDDIMDQIAVENVHSSLPPCLTEGEKTNTVEVRGSEWMDGKVVGSEEKGVEFTLDTEVKLARYNAIRVVTDDEGHMLYYNQHNSRVYQEKDLQGFPLDSNDILVIERLFQSYPDYVKIKELISNEAITAKEFQLLYVLYYHSVILVL